MALKSCFCARNYPCPNTQPDLFRVSALFSDLAITFPQNSKLALKDCARLKALLMRLGKRGNGSGNLIKRRLLCRRKNEVENIVNSCIHAVQLKQPAGLARLLNYSYRRLSKAFINDRDITRTYEKCDAYFYQLQLQMGYAGSDMACLLCFRHDCFFCSSTCDAHSAGSKSDVLSNRFYTGSYFSFLHPSGYMRWSID